MLQDARPPFVRFEIREHGIDKDASEEAGRPVPQLVEFACITSFGSKDVHEAIATEWLQKIRQKAIKGEYPPDWAQMFQMAYDEWKKGNELPRSGTPIATWQMLTPQQRMRIKAVGYTTVEDLAECPDSTVSELGLDGRHMRDTARTWVKEAKAIGSTAKELADAKSLIAQQADLIESMQARLSALEGEKRGPGRPRKQLEEV